MLDVAHGTPAPALRYECKRFMSTYAMFAPIEHLSYSMSIQTVVFTCSLFSSTLILSTYVLCDSFNKDLSSLKNCIKACKDDILADISLTDYFACI